MADPNDPTAYVHQVSNQRATQALLEHKLSSLLASADIRSEGDNGDNSNDREIQNALEVVFDTDSSSRRKSSLVDSPAPLGKQTACFVHSLLNNYGKGIISGMPAWGGNGHQASQQESPATKRHTVPPPLSKRLAVEDPSTGSRLLTKKELSDMAFGIRELAKSLAHVKIKFAVKNIFVLAKAHDTTLIKYARELARWLLRREHGKHNVFVESTLEHDKMFDAKGLFNEDSSFESRLKFWTAELCELNPQTFDMVVSLGGDGTVLYASWLFQRVVPPVLSFAMGSLGFLTRFDYGKYSDTLHRAFEDGITISLRLRFEATVMRSRHAQDGDTRDLVEELIDDEREGHHTHRPDGMHNILNEVVLDRGPNATMSSIEVFGDNKHFTTVQADGICVATPTGSTAYNLAAGGSLCHPDNPVILVTAICAHTLSFRPIILPDTIVLRVGVPYDARTSSWASFDGRERVELRPGDYVTISASRYPFPSVLPQDQKNEDWIASISQTLNWNSRQRQKAFN